MTVVTVRKLFLFLVASLFLLKIAATCQTFQTLIFFDGFVAGEPQYSSLVQGFDGNLYGTTSGGGDVHTDQGTFFTITQAGVFTRLYEFCSLPGCADGESPDAGVILGVDGNFYGTTTRGGTNNVGTIFKITPTGQLTTLHNFTSSDGGYHPPLVQALSGAFYGTLAPGAGGGDGGSIFKITPAGAFSTVYTFCSKPNCLDGSTPQGGLIQATDGNLYGTTDKGGTGTFCGNEGCGTVFKMSPGGELTTLYNFNRIDGAGPQSALLEASNGNFYGTTLSGGKVGPGFGTVFRITPGGRLTTLHTFCAQGGDTCPDGALPYAGLLQGTDGNLYGTTWGAEAYFNYGTVFQIGPTGSLTTLHYFNQNDGSNPLAGLEQGTQGKFFGTSTGGYGTIFSVDMGLGPFVSLVRNSGGVGKTGAILGQGLTGTTIVSLNGSPVPFSVVSDTLIEATIPAGATTGYVTVTTPSGILTSNQIFHVRPQLLSFDPPSGPPGTQVTITGVSLTQTLGVGFGDRTPAQFTVNSDTSVTATVPQGAKTGEIGIETKGGVAISQGTFEVTE